ncbi:family 3 glycoside hydrolase, partial [Pelagophyceae sp. CCMP2097]
RACVSPHADYAFCDASKPVDDRVADLISRLTIAEKALMLTARASPQGGVPRLGVPEYDWGANCIHGAQSRCGSRCPTSFPNPNAQAASWNRTSWRAMAAVTGKELRALWLEGLGEKRLGNLPHLGLDCWSPNININRDPRWGRNLETPGEDPYLNGEYGRVHTLGLQNGQDGRFLQAAVTLKHFAAYSLEDGGGASRHSFDAVCPKADLAATYFPAFKTAVRAGAKGVMCSYNAVNGVPSCASAFLLRDVLRKAWGFDGYVTSDSGAIQDIAENPSGHRYRNATPAEGVAYAVLAGCDVDSGRQYTSYLEEALDASLFTDADVDALLTRALKVRFEFGLFDAIEDQPYWRATVEGDVDTPEAAQLNAEAAQQALVLLKNCQGALPLEKVGKLAVVGPHANARQGLVGNYLGQLCPESQASFDCVESPAEAFAKHTSTIVAEGCDVSSNRTDGIESAVALAASADAVVLILGLDTQTVEREQHDRVDLALPGVQLDLARAVVKGLKEQQAADGVARPLIVLLLNGGAVDLSWFKAEAGIDAIVEAFYVGKVGARALADCVFGAFSPSGKLPYHVPDDSYSAETDFRDMAMTAGSGRTYRFYTKAPVYDFGFGISYSTFELRRIGKGDLRMNTDGAVTVDLVLTNTGAVFAAETVQAYFAPRNIKLGKPAPLPIRQLFDFVKVELAPQASKKLSFRVEAVALAVANADGDLVVAPGTYDLRFTNG